MKRKTRTIFHSTPQFDTCEGFFSLARRGTIFFWMPFEKHLFLNFEKTSFTIRHVRRESFSSEGRCSNGASETKAY